MLAPTLFSGKSCFQSPVNSPVTRKAASADIQKTLLRADEGVNPRMDGWMDG